MARIVLIDDSQLSRRLCDAYLRRAGHEVIAVGDGDVGLSTVAHEGADCVVTDLLMPGTSGYDVLRRMREDSPMTAVLVISADIQESTQRECQEMGAAAFVNKPVRAEALTKAIEEVLGPRKVVVN